MTLRCFLEVTCQMASGLLLWPWPALLSSCSIQRWVWNTACVLLNIAVLWPRQVFLSHLPDLFQDHWSTYASHHCSPRAFQKAAHCLILKYQPEYFSIFFATIFITLWPQVLLWKNPPPWFHERVSWGQECSCYVWIQHSVQIRAHHHQTQIKFIQQKIWLCTMC